MRKIRIIEDNPKKRPLEQLVKEVRQLLDQLIEEKHIEPGQTLAQVTEQDRKKAALSIVDETFGAMKGLDALTLTHLAEDEEFSGY